ncbi:MAG: HAMP domain-containing protein [Actinobacteria bacterium]|nr:HAMP domain-containing protein [Actinomycetota bacterium]
MSSSAAQLDFAAQFVTFLAAAAGLALVALRGELMTLVAWARAALGLGFTLIGIAAFLAGSLIVDGDATGVLVAQSVGIALAAAGTAPWHGSALGRRLMWSGLVLLGCSAVARTTLTTRSDTFGGADILTAALLALGGAAVLGALLAESRRSIAARVGASAAGTLLLVVLVLSVALSTVLSGTVEDEAIRRLDTRAATEAAFLRDRTDAARQRSDFTSRFLVNEANRDEFLAATSGQASSAALSALLEEAREFFSARPAGLGLVQPDGSVLGRAGVDEADVRAAAQTGLVEDAIARRGQRAGVEVVGGSVVVVSASPVIGPGQDVVAIVMSVETLDAGFLSDRAADDRLLSLALWSENAQLAAFGPQPSDGVAAAISRDILSTGRPETRVTPDYFVAARPIPAPSGSAAIAVVASTPTTLVAETRESLFRTLFLIALGGTILALLVAAVVGDRIGGGLRRLTRAAERIEEGRRGVRSGVRSDDEVGVLGRTFDSMAGAIEDQTAALRRAADDETRLRNRLEAVVAGMGEALIAINARGRVTDFNQAAEELLGVGAAGVRGRRAADVVQLVNAEGGDLSRRLRKPSPTRWSAVGSVIRSDRASVPVAISAGVLRGSRRELAGNVFVLRDLRKEREVERMKTEFLSRVGHELRTPLTGIKGFAEILANRNVPEERARSWHHEIVESSDKLLRIVEMLEFFAATGGSVTLRPEPLDLRRLLDDEVQLWADRLKRGAPARDGRSKPRSVTRRIARGTPTVHADPRWARAAIHELIDNAVKFSPAGGKIAIDAQPAERDGTPGVEISVKDQGIGMTEDQQAQAFGEFAQGDASDTRSYGGLGLGLALAQRVAEVHDGKLTCRSQPGSGSTFTLFLPLSVGSSALGSGNGAGRKTRSRVRRSRRNSASA